MTPTTATLVYTLQQQAGATLAALNAAMAAPTVPVDELALIGVRLTGDATVTNGTTITRTITLALGPLVTAVATATMTGDGEFIENVTVGTPGSGYTALPIVSTSGAKSLTPAVLQPTMEVVGAAIVNGGAGYSSPAVYFRGGLELPQVNDDRTLSGPSCVQALQIVNGGKGYSSNARIEFLVDGLALGAVLPTASLSMTNGVITGVLLTSTGSGLLSAPEIVVNDPGPASNGSGGGSGAVIAFQLGLGTAATATVTLLGGAIHHVSITAGGGPYVLMPDVQVLDATGSGAVLVPLMGILAINVISGGTGWQGTPTITISDLFSVLFEPPAGSTPHPPPNGPFWNLMKVAIETSVGSPIVASAPVLS